MTDWTVSLFCWRRFCLFKLIIVTSVLVLAIVVGVSWYLPISRNVEVTSNYGEEIYFPVSVALAKLQSLDEVLTFHGTLAPKAQVIVVPKVPGRVAKVHVQVGDSIHKGNVLVELEAHELRLQMQQAQAGLAMAQANLDRALAGARPAEIEQAQANFEQAQASYKNVSVTYERAVHLYEQGVMSGKDWDAITAQYTVASAQLRGAEKAMELVHLGARVEDIAAARASVAQGQAVYELARLSYENARISAPISGVVSRLNADVGGMVGTGTMVVTIVDSSSVRLQVSVGEVDVVKIRPGQQVQVLLNALPNQEITGVVATVAPAAEQGGLFPITIEISNEEGQFKPGMYGTAHIVVRQEIDVVTIPTRAISSHNGAPHVYRVFADTADLVPVSLGLQVQGSVEVQGVALGDQVVVAGQNNLRPGGRVRVTRTEE